MQHLLVMFSKLQQHWDADVPLPDQTPAAYEARREFLANVLDHIGGQSERLQFLTEFSTQMGDRVDEIEARIGALAAQQAAILRQLSLLLDALTCGQSGVSFVREQMRALAGAE